ncbi:MAG: choice-of-anchor D domain-containing protein [Candidatus Acidiferrales bacterium]
MRRVLTVLALFATLIWVFSTIFRPAEAQQSTASQTASGATPIVIVSGAQYAGVRGLAVDASGSLYISLEANPAPTRCVSRSARNASSNSPGESKLTVTVFSDCASTPAENPSGIAVTPEGRVFLANRLQNRIRLLDMATGKVAVVPSPAAKNAARAGTSNLDLFEPAGLAMDLTQNLYIADRGNHRVIALRPGATKFTYLAHVLDAAAVAVDSARSKLFVASPASNRIFEIDLASGDVNAFAGTGAFPGSNSARFPAPVSPMRAAIAAPEGIAVDGAGNVFIADTGANAILRVSAKSGILLRVALTTNLNSPGALAIDRNGNLFAADRGNHRVVEFPGLAAPAATAAVTISPAQFDFGAEPTGGTTPIQVFTLTNNSASALSLSTTDFTFTGTNPNDFTQTNDCVPQVPAGASCQINVAFAPQGSGARAAVLQVADADPSSPQTAQVSGTGDDFEITAAPSASIRQNVVPGNSATFNLQITPDATFSGTVTPVCPLQLPSTTLTCTIKPATVSVTAGQPAPFTVTIGTAGPNATAQTAPAPENFPRGPISAPLFAALTAIFLLLIFSARCQHSRRARALAGNLRNASTRARFAISAFAVAAALAAGGCYHHSAAPYNPNATAPGIYGIDISATAQNASRAISITVNVE